MAIYRGPGGSGDATTDAANQASVASNKAAEAVISATAAAGSASSAATSASTATTRATAASTSATNASNSETAAASSATSAAASFDSFDDRYLGAKSSNPTLDNDGDALSAGALYFNTVSNVMQTYTGSAWQSITTGGAGLLAANNLSDVSSASTSRTNLGVAIGTNVQAFSSVLAATTASYTTAEKSKLSGIEASATADQTGAEIKTAYQAEANAFTDTQFTKLSGIEASATADQTAGEIKTAYESNANTNAFTDAQVTKLSGIETSADVTDGTNVTAAGALMDSEVTNLAQVKAFDTTDYATAAQGTLAASANQPATTVAKSSATGSAAMPTGTTAQRDASPATGNLRFNSTDTSFEGYNGSAWGVIGGGGTVIGKNKIINGNLGINQRAVSGSVVLAAGVYGHDRWKAGASGCSYTFATAANVTTITISAGSLLQVIEGLNLQSGTHTLSWTGTATAKIDAGSYSASGITGTATGGTNMTIDFSTGTLSLVQLEEGSAATPFEHRQYGTELVLCERYYQFIKTGITTSSGATGLNFSYPTEMRASPTATRTGNGPLGSGAVTGSAFISSSGWIYNSGGGTSSAYTLVAEL